MLRQLRALAAMVLGIGLTWQSVSADGPLQRHHARPTCEPGYQIIEEIIYQDVVKTVCKMVPETKTKWVYSSVDDPICIKDSRHGHCPNCMLVCRRVLVKKLVDEPCPTMKCVTEIIVEKVPVTIYKKVPCATVTDAPKVELLRVQPQATTAPAKK